MTVAEAEEVREEHVELIESILLQIPLPAFYVAEDGVTTLRTQVGRWLSDIVRPLRITVRWPAGLTARMIR